MRQGLKGVSAVHNGPDRSGVVAAPERKREKNEMSIARCLMIAAVVALFLSPTVVGAQTALRAFDGSVEKARYETEFEAFSYAETDGSAPTVKRVEGSLVSRVLLKPEAKSNLEVFRSYEQELRAAGFTILLAATPSEGSPQRLMREVCRAPHNDLSSRPYQTTNEPFSTGDLPYLATFGQFYLAASRTSGGDTLYVGIVLSRERNLYLIDELTTAAMETGTVTLSLETMRSRIDEAGKIAVYDIRFATGSADIDPASADALSVIATYLSETGGGFYIVGHTDDTGTLEANLSLSTERAAAVKVALVADFGVSADQLETHGVGPLVPVSNNTGDAGRALNRRVEIVQRLED